MAMDDISDLLDEAKSKDKTNWRRLLIALVVGGVLTAICFILDWWWPATICMLIALFVACTAIKRGKRTLAFTFYAMLAIGWVSGSVLDTVLPERWSPIQGWRTEALALSGALLGVFAPLIFWAINLFISTRWILAISQSFDVSFGRAFKIVLAQIFNTSQQYLIIENGKITVEKPKGALSNFGGPGVLVIGPGNVVVLERGGKMTRMAGSGLCELKRFEYPKRPPAQKGIVDLQPQWAMDTVEDMLTKDGIPLTIQVGMSYQIEPKAVTDERVATDPRERARYRKVIDSPPYQVYEETIRRAVFETTAAGWKSLFPWGAINAMRDVVAVYTLDQIFPPTPSPAPNPDARMVKAIEDEVKRRFNPAWAGVRLIGFDILQVAMPKEVRERMIQRWTVPVDRQLQIEQARAERDVLIERSAGRARSLAQLEQARHRSWQDVIDMVSTLLRLLDGAGNPQVAINFISVIQELTRWAGEDESVTARYIEAMNAVIKSSGSKTFVFNAPSPPIPLTPGTGGRQQQGGGGAMGPFTLGPGAGGDQGDAGGQNQGGDQSAP
jgi:regulator of protease activity HflC (stomatin/prohibitin superfamily)